MPFAVERQQWHLTPTIRNDDSNLTNHVTSLVTAVALDHPLWSSHITFMALSRKKATTIALDPEDDRLLSRAARERGVSRSEFVRQHLALTRAHDLEAAETSGCFMPMRLAP